MCVGFPTAGTWSSSPWRPDDEFETDTFASWLIMKGASLRSVAELLGHRELRMVMRYAHLSQEHLSAEVGLLDSTTAPPAPTETECSERARKGQRA